MEKTQKQLNTEGTEETKVASSVAISTFFQTDWVCWNAHFKLGFVLIPSVSSVSSVFNFVFDLLPDTVMKNLLRSATARDCFSRFFIGRPTTLRFALIPVLLAPCECQFAFRFSVSEIHASWNQG